MLEENTYRREMTESEQKSLAKYLEELKTDADANQEQRTKANEDMRFIYVPDGMWEGYFEKEYTDRAKPQFDITTAYKNRFIGEYNTNRVGVDYKPDDEATSDDDAETLTGLRNRDFRKHDGKLSRDNAVDELAVCGYGAYKLGTAFEDEGDPENENQNITFRPIHNAYASVIWDTAAKWINKKDARRCVELVEYTEKSFKEQYPGAEPVSAYEPEDLRYFNNDGIFEKIIFVACRYEIIKKKETVRVYHDLRNGKIVTIYKDQEEKRETLEADEYVEFVRTRKVTRNSVFKTVFSGKEILKKTKRVAGRYIPIIPMYAYRGFVDGLEWYKGFVRPLKDPQRVFNMQIGQLMENTASSGQDKPIFDPDQMPEEIKELWADLTNKPYLLAKALRDAEGNVIASGPIGYLKTPQLDQQMSALIEMVLGYVQQVTGGAPQDTLDPNASGKAIQALLKRENLNSQDAMDNIGNATEWEGTVYAAMAEEIYSHRRAMRILGKDGTEAERVISELVMDPDQGRMVEKNSILGKRFRAYSDIGPQYDTLKEQAMEERKSMLEALKDTEAGAKYTPALIASIFAENTGPGSDILRKLARRELILQGLVDPETDEEKAFAAKMNEPQADPQKDLMDAAAEQARAEGRERDSKTLVNTADAQKKQAETEKLLEELGRDNFKSLLDIRKAVLSNVESLPLG